MVCVRKKFVPFVIITFLITFFIINAYGNAMRAQSDLVKYLTDNNTLKSSNIINAFSTIDRIDFMADKYKHRA